MQKTHLRAPLSSMDSSDGAVIEIHDEWRPANTATSVEGSTCPRRLKRLMGCTPAGRGFAPSEREALALATLAGSIVITLLLWIFGYLFIGG